MLTLLDGLCKQNFPNRLDHKTLSSPLVVSISRDPRALPETQGFKTMGFLSSETRAQSTALSFSFLVSERETAVSVSGLPQGFKEVMDVPWWRAGRTLCRQEIYMGAFIHYLIGFRVLPHKVMVRRKRSKMQDNVCEVLGIQGEPCKGCFASAFSLRALVAC